MNAPMTPLTAVRTAQLLKMSWARISSGDGRRKGGSGSLLDAMSGELGGRCSSQTICPGDDEAHARGD